MARLVAVLTLGMLLLSAASALAALPIAHADSHPSISTHGSSSWSGPTYHLMTEAEMLQARAAWGSRQPDVDYNTMIDGHGTGLAPPTDEQWYAMVGRTMVLDQTPIENLDLPAAYDLSLQPYFPKVGDQGSQGSCGAWAATYYAYGYLEALDNNWTDAKAGTDPSHLMSPLWTYNKVNGGKDSGSWMADNFQVIIDWGAASLATMPYNPLDVTGWGSAEAFREAPLHRASSYTEEYWLRGNEAVTVVKNRVAANMPITFALDASQYYASFHDNYIMSSKEYNSLKENHANTIVGYDDSITEDGEQGAFKVVNSWGANWGNQGYYWLTYEALIEISNGAGLFLTEVQDRIDYVPQMLAVWHFDTAPNRAAAIRLCQGGYPSVSQDLNPYFAPDMVHNLPTFMCLDLTEFSAAYDEGNISFWIELNQGGAGVLSSFRIEKYENGYVPGAATQASQQSLEVPKNMPGHAAIVFPDGSPIAANPALDTNGLTLIHGGQARWVGVALPLSYDGDALQSGDIGDAGSSTFQVAVSACSGVSFQWKVSSETGKDAFRFLIDGVEKLARSGDVDWQSGNYLLTAGPHTLRWEYLKDPSGSKGKDMAWVDHLRLSPPDDGFEENDDASQARQLNSSGHYSGLMCLDEDWFKVLLNASSTLSVQVDHDPMEGSLAVSLYGTDATTLLDSSHSASGADSVTTGRVFAPGFYFLRIVSSGGSFVGYSITQTLTSGWFDEGSTSRLTIISATGDFAAITSTQREITATTGASLSGTIKILGNATWDTTVNVPLIATPTWSSHASAYWTVASNMTRTVAVYSTTIDHLALPTAPGTYYLIFAARNETDGEHVASATSSLVPNPIWDDGNDIAALGTDQLNQAMSGGRTAVQWFMSNHTELVWVPADAIRLKVIAPDTTPPSTMAKFVGTQGLEQWYRSSVKVTLTATDPNGSGTKESNYRVDGAQWRIYDQPVIISLDGTHILEFYSQDYAGNAEYVHSLGVKIDKVAPSVAVSSNGTWEGSGWYVTPVTFHLSATDSISGPSGIFYQVNSQGWTIYNGTELILSSEGEHLIEYYAVDHAGNPSGVQAASASIDLEAPNTTLAIGGSTFEMDWYSGTVSLNLTAVDAGSGVSSTLYVLNDGPVQVYSGNITLENPGEHHLSFYSVDRAGRVEATKQTIIKVDDSIPDCQATLSAGLLHDGWYNASAILNLSATDDQSGIGAILFRVAPGDWQTYNENITFADGIFQIEFYARNRAGLESEHHWMELQIDTSGPVCSASIEGETAASGWYNSAVRLNISAADGLSGTQAIFYRVDGPDWLAVTSAVNITGEGEHLIEAYALDDAGNRGITVNWTINIDQKAPISELRPEGDIGQYGWFISVVRVEVHSVDATSGLNQTYLSLDGANWTSLAGDIHLQEDGIHVLRYYSTDMAGNVESYAEATVKIDRSGPTSQIIINRTEAVYGWYGSEVRASIESGDAMSGLNQSYYRMDGGNWMLADGSFVIGEGKHLVEWYAIDLAGNPGDHHSQAVNLDLSPPETDHRLTGTGGSGGWFLTNVSLELEAYDGLSGLNRTWFRLDGAPWDEYGSEIRVEGEGTHLVSFYSIDLIGNIEPQENLTIRIDLKAPITAYMRSGSLGAGDWLVTPANLSFSSSDGVSGLGSTTYRLDEGDWTTYQAPFWVNTSGRHIIEFHSIDRAGNTEPMNSLHLDVDLSPPMVRCNEGGRVFNTRAPVISWQAEDNTSGIYIIEIGVDGGAMRYAGPNSSLGLQNLADGTHEVRLRATDQAGNSAVQVVQFRVDTSPFSPQGPLGPWLLVGMIVIAIALLLVALGLNKRKNH